MFEYEPMAGDYIETAIRMLMSKTPAFMVFNGIRVEARPGDTAEGIEARWRVDFEAAHKAYQNSPEGIAAEAERQRVKADHQKRVTRLVQDLEDAGWWSTEQTMRWVASFTSAADHIDLEWNREAVAERLERWGWRCDDALGHDPIEYREDLELCARWIMGQVISGIRGSGGSPHPGLASFADRWLKENEEKTS